MELGTITSWLQLTDSVADYEELFTAGVFLLLLVLHERLALSIASAAAAAASGREMSGGRAFRFEYRCCWRGDAGQAGYPR